MFDPSFISQNLTPAFIDKLRMIAPLAHHINIDQLKLEAPLYLSAAVGFSTDHGDVKTFTNNVLKWFSENASKIPEWARAARVIFFLTPSSAACERVFSLIYEGRVWRQPCFGSWRCASSCTDAQVQHAQSRLNMVKIVIKLCLQSDRVASNWLQESFMWCLIIDGMFCSNRLPL